MIVNRALCGIWFIWGGFDYWADGSPAAYAVI
jgi:hypothetical protein